MGLFDKTDNRVVSLEQYKKLDTEKTAEIDALKKKLQETKDEYERKTKETHQDHEFDKKALKQEHALELSKRDSAHALELKQKEFDITHFKDEELAKKEEVVVEMTKKVAVLENENKMLREVADLNGDIIDIKELFNKLIEKLPEIKLTTLAGAAPAKTKE